MRKNKDEVKKEKMLLEEQKFLLELKRDITDLEAKLKWAKFKNMKSMTIKNLKITARAVQLVAPFVITSGLVTALFPVVYSGSPFKIDEYNVYANVMTEFDSAGNIRTERQYNTSGENVLYLYSKWQPNNDGSYSRTGEMYDLNDYTYESVIELFGKKNLQIEDILGTPISRTEETSNNVSEEELSAETFLKAIIYEQDTNDFIVIKESLAENCLDSFYYLVLLFLLEALVAIYRIKYSKFDFQDTITKIKEEHQLLDEKEIAKKLELRRANYERLMR